MIVFIHSALPIGGAEVLRKFVTKEIYQRNIDLRICLIKGGGQIAQELEDYGIIVDTIGCSRSIYNPLTTLALVRYFKKHHPQIVQSSQFNSNFHTRIAAKLAGVPCVVCEEHGVYHWKDWWHRLADRFLANWCDKIIAVSQAVKNFNVNEIGIPEDKIEILHNCLNTDRSSFVRSRDDIRTEFGISTSDFVIGHVGTLRNEKGHDILLKAFKLFCIKQPAKLLLVGDGPLKTQLKKEADALDITDNIIFTGTRSDVPDLLKAMDLFVFPSRNEAMGIALLEAMYSGLPVIAAKTGGIPEIVTEGETGLLVESENVGAFALTMLQLAENPALRQALGKAASAYVASHHSPQTYVDQLLAIHHQLLLSKGMS